jgi:zinc D-Ala-D-Ala dipeptidase
MLTGKKKLRSLKILWMKKVINFLKTNIQLLKTIKLPKVADPVIKEIPIHESGKKLIDLKKNKHSRIEMLPNPTKPFESDAHNSGYAASSKMRLSVYKKLKALIPMLDKNAAHFGYKKGQISIRVFEGLRDLKTQEMLFKNKEKEISAQNPTLSPEEIFKETCKWVSPVKDNIPVHSTGAAVDIRLYDNLKKDFVDMGKFGVIWGENKSAPTFSENITPAQIKNRLFLLISALKVGLINYPYEYWHLSSGDKYAAYWLESNPQKRKARYGGIS